MDNEVREFLQEHLQAILENNIDLYRGTTSEDLTLYEWWITPHRIEGLPFHEFMMLENKRLNKVFGSEGIPSQMTSEPHTRLDLANLHIQRYDNTAIASYTLLISVGLENGVSVSAHNESRVMIKINNQWKVVHVHKSPAWNAPHVPA